MGYRFQFEVQDTRFSDDLRENGVVIDLSQMRAITVDPVARTAHVQAGATGELIEAAENTGWRPLQNRLQRWHDRTDPGGGYGSLIGVYGLAADNLLSTGRHCRRAAYYREHRRASRPALGTTRRRR